MRITLLSVGVPAGGFASRKKIARLFSEPAVFSPQERRTHPDTLSLIFQPLNFSTKKRQLNYILKNRETGDNRPIARFLLYYYVDYFTVTILFTTLKLTVFCLNGKTASAFNLMPFFAPPFSGYKTSNPKSA